MQQKDDQQWQQHQQKQQYQHSFEDHVPKTTEMTSTTWDLSRDLLWDVEDSLQKNSLNVHFNSLSNHCNKKAQNREVAGNLKQKSTATIWRENCTSLSRRHRADLVEKRGSVLVCDLAALTRVAGRSGPDVPRDIKNCALQSEQAQKSRHQSSRLLRRERERKMRDSVREQRQVKRLLAAAVSPSCGGTQLGMSVTPRTLHSVADVVEESSGMKKNITNEEKPQRHWMAVSWCQDHRQDDGNGTEGNRAINRTPDDGVLLFVTVFIRGKQFTALVDSGASRCFVSPSVLKVLRLQGKRSDTFLELGNGQRVLSRGYVPEVSVTVGGHTSSIDLTVTSLLHNAEIILGMNWLQAVRPVIDWVTGEIYIPNSVTTSLIQGEWLQSAVKAGTVTVLSSIEDMQEFQNERVKEGLSIIKVPQFWEYRKKNDTERLWAISPSGGNSYCTLLKDQKENDEGWQK